MPFSNLDEFVDVVELGQTKLRGLITFIGLLRNTRTQQLQICTLIRVGEAVEALGDFLSTWYSVLYDIEKRTVVDLKEGEQNNENEESWGGGDTTNLVFLQFGNQNAI